MPDLNIVSLKVVHSCLFLIIKKNNDLVSLKAKQKFMCSFEPSNRVEKSINNLSIMVY